MQLSADAAFLDALLSSMDASHASQTTSASHPAPPPSTLASQPPPTLQASSNTEEIEQLFDGAEDWNWEDDLLETGMPEAKADAIERLPERIVAPDVKERFTPAPYTRCIVQNVEQQTVPKRQKVLTVRLDDKSRAQCLVLLTGDWITTEVLPGDIINVIGAFSPATSTEPSQIEINAQSNFLIHHPDVLVTATSIASSTPCLRKPLVTSLLPQSNANATSQALVWGTMLHEIFQSCLAQGRWDDAFISLKTDEIVRAGLGDLVKLDVSVEVAKTEIAKRAKGLQGFSRRFIGTTPKPDAVLTDTRSRKGDETLLAICGLHDTEEDIWSPRFGLKGKLDASVQVILDDKDSSSKLSMPLEIKTGWKASMEHRAQTMLYTILMEERYGAQIPSGLLYYTQNDEVIRVDAARNELRSLIQNRNRMVGYMMRRDTSTLPSSSACNFLPPTEDDERMCGKCYAVDGCMLYRKAVENVTDETSEIASLYAAKTSHLTPPQCEFFKKWEELISLEERDILRFRRELWTLGAEEREKTGRCFANMILVDGAQEKGGVRASIHRWTYTFSRKTNEEGKAGVAKGSSVLSILSLNKSKTTKTLSTKPSSPPILAPTPSLLSGQISKGDAVTISIEPDLLSLTRGYVLSLEKDKITVGVDRELDVKTILGRKYGDEIPSQYSMNGNADNVVFRIDRDELAAGIGRIRNNVAQLFYAGGDTKRLELVVDLKKPAFDPLPSTLDPHPVLNADQQLAMQKVLSARDYAILLGMPGTGKTTTIAEIIKELVKRGKSVLLSSYTHSAVDTILMKLLDVDFEVLRLGNADKIHPDVYKMSLAARPIPTSVEQLEQQLLSPPVVATTCLSIDHTLFSRRHFDVCIVDEASQITLPTCLGPLRFADTFVLVGDHNQLPPLVRSPQARKGGLDISLFRILSEAHPDAVVELGLQYRMNEDIMRVSNELVYQGRLKCGNEEVAKSSLVLKEKKALGPFHSTSTQCSGINRCWIKDLVDPTRRVVFVDTDFVPSKESRIGDLVQNEVEAQLVAQLVKALILGGVEESQIGIISLYRQQIKLLSHLIEPHKGVETLTADRSQGRDKDCIIISMCRSNDTNSIGDLLKDWRRLNVSFTRARSKLVIFGSRKTLSTSPLLGDFFELMERQSWIYQLPPGANVSHESGSGSGNRGIKRKRGETMLEAEDKENAVPLSRPSPRKKPRLESSKAGVGAGALLRGREMLRDVVMDLQML